MKEATVSELTISELQAGLSGYLERVKAGEELVVTEDGKPVARVVPVVEEEPITSEEARRADLIRRGIIRPPSRS
ncbi:MAG: type II toxin-antitoxin system prevent-host-death family antitoxin [Chloroflexi bacterium]|nr:type II toxin-antitoxin system prevent-host-death family antitoxin [Chloroflexota bacterium]